LILANILSFLHRGIFHFIYSLILMNTLLLIKRISGGLALFLFPILLSASTPFGSTGLSYNTTAAKDLICQADFEVIAFSGDNPTAGGITFYNLSQGSYDHLSWDFGDGNYCAASSNSINHTYANSGTYNVSLTIWDNAGLCSSNITKTINIVVFNDPCILSPCVWPGDANLDGQADAYDILPLGLGYGATGPARNGDPSEWFGQIAEDWDYQTADGTNYKHLDTNGDGIINELDMIPIIEHYSPMKEELIYTDNNGPRVYLDFDVDTIVINQATGATVNLSAGLVIGDADNPVENLHGLSLFLEYDTTLTDLSSGILLNYNSSSFFGAMNEVIPYGRNIASTRQIDIGMTKKAGNGATGHGRIATLDFIIIIDIIDGRVENEVPFDVPIKGVKAIDADGNIIKLSLEEQPATVIFVDETPATGTKENLLNSKINIYPNPAKGDFITIEIQDLQASDLLIYNTLGQLIKSVPVTANQMTLSVSDLPAGIYELQIQTAEGMAVKRLVIE
jgi:PKD repeat protein